MFRVVVLLYSDAFDQHCGVGIIRLREGLDRSPATRVTVTTAAGTQIFSTSTVMFINNRRAVGFNNKIVSSVSVSRFDGHFPGGPGLAATRMSPFWTLLELRVMVVVTVGAVRCAKLRSEFHHQQTNTQFFTGWMPFLSPYQQCQSTEGKNLNM